MKKIMKKFFSDLKSVRTSTLISIIKKSNCQLVSFDIFDTLIKRNVNTSSDVYLILENNYQKFFNKKTPISKLRIDAEKIANKLSEHEDVSLEDIYNVFPEVNENEKEWLKKEEIRLEKIICQVNYKMMRVYQWCKENNYRIIITSDMYLPRKVIEEILTNAGYSGWHSLYISNEYGVRKSSGNLFSVVLNKEKINPEKVIHIGDAEKGDYISAKNKGINAVLIKQNEDNTEFFNKKYLLYERNEHNYEYSVINSFIKNNINISYNYYEKIGYEIVGPILYGYSLWLKGQAKKRNINKLFFLAREGSFLRKAFNIIDGGHTYNRLIRVSRKATSLPLLYKAKNVNELLDIINTTKANFTIRKMLVSMHFPEQKIKKILEESHLGEEYEVSDLTGEQKGKFFDLLKPEIDIISKQQEDYIKGYLRRFDFSDDLGLCDVGWHGTIQQHLQSIFKSKRIEGFYIGKKDKEKDKKVLSEAYLFSNSLNTDIQGEIMSAPDLFELFFLSTDGSTLAYDFDKEKGSYYCVQADPEQTPENAKDIIMLQSAALKFLNDFKFLREKLNISLTPYVSTAAYSSFINSPSLKTINALKNFSFLNVVSHSLVAEHNIFFYMVRPRIFMDEFLNSGSKVIFLKSVFKIQLPYVKLIKLMRKFDRS